MSKRSLSAVNCQINVDTLRADSTLSWSYFGQTVGHNDASKTVKTLNGTQFGPLLTKIGLILWAKTELLKL